MTTSLVTGGAGFIGSHLVDSLLESGHHVRVLDNFSTGDRGNLLHLLGDVEVIEGDLRSLERVLHAVRGCDYVYHQAALPSVPRSVQDPSSSNEVNVTGTLNVLMAARDCGVRRVIYASSSSAYGAIPIEVKSEDLPVAPLSPYGVAKYAGEAYCMSFHNVYGLETVALRYFNIFGPRQSPASEYAAVIPNFMSCALLGEQPVIYGDGEQCRDFTYVENAVQANRLAAESDGAPGHVFNVACGDRTTVNELAVAVGDAAGVELNVRRVDPRTGDVRVSVANIEKARSILGYSATVNVEEGLRRTWERFSSDESVVEKIEQRRRWLAASA